MKNREFFKYSHAFPLGGIVGIVCALPIRAQILTAGSARLQFENQNGSFGLSLSDFANALFRQDVPLALELDAVAGTTLLQGRYTGVYSIGTDTVIAKGSLVSVNGTRFDFRDTYSATLEAGVFAFARSVMVVNPNAADLGFATRFSLPLAAEAAYADCDIFIPGIRYGDTTGMPPWALTASNSDENMFIREDRLPLPLALLRRKADGTTLMMLHRDPDGATTTGDNTPLTRTDVRFQYASLGIHNRARPGPGMWYPGSEGDRRFCLARTLGHRGRFRPIPAGPRPDGAEPNRNGPFRRGSIHGILPFRVLPSLRKDRRGPLPDLCTLSVPQHQAGHGLGFRPSSGLCDSGIANRSRCGMLAPRALWGFLQEKRLAALGHRGWVDSVGAARRRLWLNGCGHARIEVLGILADPG